MKRTFLILLIALVSLSLSCSRQEEPAPEAPAAATESAPVETAAAAPAAAALRIEGAPFPVDGLVLWLRADRGVASATDGAVTEWKTEGGDIAASQTDPVKQPRLVADAANGGPAIRFDGDGDILEAPVNINPSVMKSVTVVAVFRSATAEASPYRKLYGHDDGGYDRVAGLDDRGDRSYGIFGGNAGVVGYFDLQPDTWVLTVDSFGEAGFSGWVNGQKVLDNVAIRHDDGLPTFFIGGTGTVFDEPWKGDVAEVLVFDRPLPEETRLKLEDDLAGRYAIPLPR